MGKQKVREENVQEQDAGYEKLWRRNQICVGICIAFALVTVAMVIASMQDAAMHSALRTPVVLTGITGLALCWYGVRLDGQMQKNMFKEGTQKMDSVQMDEKHEKILTEYFGANWYLKFLAISILLSIIYSNMK